MASISPVKTPQGVLFTCRLPQAPLPRSLTGRRYVLLDGVQDPGNVGTILRTLDAFDADGLCHRGSRRPPTAGRRCASSMGPCSAAPSIPAHRRNWRPCCTEQRACLCTGRPAGVTPWTPGRRTHLPHAGHRQRGPWPEPGGTEPVRSNHPHPHVGPCESLNVRPLPQRCCCGKAGDKEGSHMVL